MYKRITSGVLILVLLAVGVYLVYFQHGPATNILAANKARRTLLSGPRARLAAGKDYDDDDYSDESPPSQTVESIWRWNDFVEDMNLVSIGEVYDKCEGDDRIMIGRTALMEDTKNGGLKARTYTNFTLPQEITGGLMYIECKYNGKDLYANHWDLCTVEDEDEERIIFCPVQPGKKRFVKDNPVPGYLPKGNYYTKAWMTDQNGKVFSCGYTQFTL